MLSSTLSSWVSELVTLVMLPLYWVSKLLCCCNCNNLAAPTGSSPALWMRFPELICAWVLAVSEKFWE